MSSASGPSWGVDPALVVRIEEALTRVTATSANEILGEWSHSIAARDLADYWRKILVEQGISIDPHVQQLLLSELLNRLVEAITLAVEQKKLQQQLPPPDEGSDGSDIDVSDERFPPWLFFEPHLIGRDQEGLHHTIARAIQASPPALQPALWGNVVLAGPHAGLPGLMAALHAALSSLAPAGVPVRVRIA